MRRLIYASRWTPAIADDIDVALMRIVARSIPNNRAASLTGFLVAADGVFLQVLEGPGAAIARTYGRIAADPRHDRLTVVSDHAAMGRKFSDWNMGGLCLPADDRLWAEIREGDRFAADAALDFLVMAALSEARRERLAALGVA